MSGNFWIIIGVICGAVSLFSIPYGFYLKSKEESGNIVLPFVTEYVEDDKITVYGDYVEGDKIVNQELASTEKLEAGQQKILDSLERLYERLGQERDISSDNPRVRAKKTFELAKNFNANFLLKEGYEKKGGVGTIFTPSPHFGDKPERRFFLTDLVGNLDKNRISVFIENNLLFYVVLNSDGKKYEIKLDISSWERGQPYLIMAQWQAEEDAIKLFVGKYWTDEQRAKFDKLNDEQRAKVGAKMNEHREFITKKIPGLNFDVLGPIVFVGIDFEGNFPAKLKRGRPKLSERLIKSGWSEHEK